jgi:hypothetical protein
VTVSKAHLQHGINRIVILDIDLHHGAFKFHICGSLFIQKQLQEMEHNPSFGRSTKRHIAKSSNKKPEHREETSLTFKCIMVRYMTSCPIRVR